MNGQVEQNQDAAQGQYQYQPQYQPQPQLQRGHGGGWIVFMRVLLWIQFSCIVLVGVAAFVVGANNDAAGRGFLILTAAVLVAFLSVTIGMILLDVAQNVKRMTDNSAVIGASILRQEQQGK